MPVLSGYVFLYQIGNRPMRTLQTKTAREDSDKYRSENVSDLYMYAIYRIYVHVCYIFFGPRAMLWWQDEIGHQPDRIL